MNVQIWFWNFSSFPLICMSDLLPEEHLFDSLSLWSVFQLGVCVRPLCSSFSRLLLFWVFLYRSLPFYIILRLCVLSHFSRVRFFASPWTVTCQAPLSIGFSRQVYWSVLPHPPPGGLPNPGIRPKSLMYPALAGGFFTTSTAWRAQF